MVQVHADSFDVASTRMAGDCAWHSKTLGIPKRAATHYDKKAKADLAIGFRLCNSVDPGYRTA
jgi:hypothetical protein